jgi:hypothetical protein
MTDFIKTKTTDGKTFIILKNSILAIQPVNNNSKIILTHEIEQGKNYIHSTLSYVEIIKRFEVEKFLDSNS